MCGFGDFALGDLFESVDALAGGVEGIHEMHLGLRVLSCGYSVLVRGNVGRVATGPGTYIIKLNGRTSNVLVCYFQFGLTEYNHVCHVC